MVYNTLITPWSFFNGLRSMSMSIIKIYEYEVFLINYEFIIKE